MLALSGSNPLGSAGSTSFLYVRMAGHEEAGEGDASRGGVVPCHHQDLWIRLILDVQEVLTKFI